MVAFHVFYRNKPAIKIFAHTDITSASGNHHRFNFLGDTDPNMIEQHEAAIRMIISGKFGDPVSSAVLKKLRATFGESPAGELFTVAQLQTKAKRKFDDGSRIEDDRVWWVTDRALQQSTPWQVARLKASWLADRPVSDLCCGLGGDAMQFSRHNHVLAVDCDAQIASYASRNLRADNSDSTEVVCANVLTLQSQRDHWIHVDPDRRPTEKRTTHPDTYLPSFDQIEMIFRNAKTGGLVKLAPAARFSDDKASALLNSSHRCWMSLSGSVREQTLIVGEACDAAKKETGGRSAVSINRVSDCVTFSVGADEYQSVLQSGIEWTDAPGDLLVDPDAAIRAAGLTESYARHFGLAALGGPSGFLTSSIRTCQNTLKELTSMSVVGHVLWTGGYDEKRVKKAFRKAGWYAKAVKTRGSRVDPIVTAKRLADCGEKPVTLWISQIHKRIIATVTETRVPDH